MKSVRFIHGADLHLDSPMIGLKHLPNNIFNRLQESTFQALKNLINAAIENRVDFVILAGDLFDIEDRSVRAQIRLRKEMERLNEAGIEVFVVHGNHDYTSGNSVHIEMPNNVHVFGENVEVMPYEVNGTIVHLYGFSYEERHVMQRKIDDYHLLEGADFHIGILHGNLEGNKEHGNYAPFGLKDLVEKNFHYWALGHIHKRMVLNESPPIVYPGNIQGRNRKEQDWKGCYLVTLNEVQCSLQFIETSDCIWTEIVIDASDLVTFDDLYHLCTETISNSIIEGKGILAHLLISNLSAKISLQVLNELLETLQEEEMEEESFLWPITIHVGEVANWKREELTSESDFYSELFQVMDGMDDIDDSIASLYTHHSVRKFLPSLTEEEVAELKIEAENVLIQKLLGYM